MSHLVPCLSCNRHVLAVEERCPFCGAERSAELRASTPPAPPRRRLGRAALFTFGATLVSAACSETTAPPDGGGAGMTGDASGAAGTTGKAGTGGSAGTTGAAGTAASGNAGTGVAPAYGAPAPLYGLPATGNAEEK
jgi:hypothetical protein